MYVIRRDHGGHRQWLTRETPKIVWGSRDDAKVYSSAFLAQRTIKRLGGSTKLTMERNAAPRTVAQVLEAPKAALQKIEEAVATALSPDEAEAPPG